MGLYNKSLGWSNKNIILYWARLSKKSKRRKMGSFHRDVFHLSRGYRKIKWRFQLSNNRFFDAPNSLSLKRRFRTVKDGSYKVSSEIRTTTSPWFWQYRLPATIQVFNWRTLPMQFNCCKLSSLADVMNTQARPTIKGSTTNCIFYIHKNVAANINPHRDDIINCLKNL